MAVLPGDLATFPPAAACKCIAHCLAFFMYDCSGTGRNSVWNSSPLSHLGRQDRKTANERVTARKPVPQTGKKWQPPAFEEIVAVLQYT